MIDRPEFSSDLLAESQSQSPHSAECWIAIVLLIIFATVGSLGGAGKFLNVAFPVASLAVGILLYFRNPLLYVGFSWWMWFLTAFLRRVADYRSGFTEFSPMLLAPYLVSMLTLITLLRYFPKAHRIGGLPFILAAVGISYGFLIGLINRAPLVVFREVLDWIVPVSFGFYILVNWRQYPAYRQNIQRVFTWGVLVMGIYGIIQFVAIPEWDRLWVIESEQIFAAGTPDENGGTRVWSTMQSGEPFSAVMAGALLVLLTARSVVSIPSAVAGYMAFLLSLVRSGWLGWLGGFLVLAGSLKVKFQIRLIVTVAVMIMCIIPLTALEPFSARIAERVETLSNVQEDGSATGRQETFRESIIPALGSAVGQGIGGGTRDNVILAIFFDLGWLGSTLYIGALMQLIFWIFKGAKNKSDPFIATTQAVVMTALVRLPVNGSILGVSGILLWSFLALGISANRYYQQSSSDSEFLI